jgi:CBS-domain-containing membrane protein
MPHSVPVSKLMISPKNWPLLRADITISQAIKTLRIISEESKLEHGHSTPFVLDDDYTPLGFVHLVDLLKGVRHLCEKQDAPCELDMAETKLRTLVVPFAGTVQPEDSVLKAIDLMMEKGVSIVPVLSGKKLEGILKLSDLFNSVAAILFDAEIPKDREQLLRMGRVHW